MNLYTANLSDIQPIFLYETCHFFYQYVHNAFLSALYEYFSAQPAAENVSVSRVSLQLNRAWIRWSISHNFALITWWNLPALHSMCTITTGHV